MESRRTLLGTAAVAGGLIVAPSVVSATPPSIGAQTISSAAELRIAATPAGLRSARVDVFAFPTPRSTQPDYKMRKVGQARVTDSGIIRFPSVPSSRLRRFALGTGIVNLEAFAYAGRRTASWSHSDLPDRLQPNRKASFRLAEGPRRPVVRPVQLLPTVQPRHTGGQPCREVTARGRLPLLPPSS